MRFHRMKGSVHSKIRTRSPLTWRCLPYEDFPNKRSIFPRSPCTAIVWGCFRNNSQRDGKMSTLPWKCGICKENILKMCHIAFVLVDHNWCIFSKRGPTGYKIFLNLVDGGKGHDTLWHGHTAHWIRKPCISKLKKKKTCELTKWSKEANFNLAVVFLKF